MVKKIDFGRKGLKTLAVAGMVLVLSVSGFASQSFAATSGFKDVSPNYWAYDEIKALTDMNIIKGHTDGTYRPHDEVTRAQSAMLIVRTLGISTENRPNPNFTDVSTKTSGYEEIATLVDLGVLAKAPKFNPARGTSRAEMAKMLTLAFELTGTTTETKKFKDVPSDHFFYDYIDKLVANKVTMGTAPTLYSPSGKVTRVQMAVFLKRVMDIGKADTPPVTETPVEPDPPVVEDPKPDPTKFPAVPAGETALMEGIFKLVNAERAKEGLPALKYHKRLEEVALVKSKDMADHDYFGHDSPVYGDPLSLIRLAGIYPQLAAENLTVVYTTPEAVVKAWMDSPGHRTNILAGYTHMGVGTYKGGSYGLYHTLVLIKE